MYIRRDLAVLEITLPIFQTNRYGENMAEQYRNATIKRLKNKERIKKQQQFPLLLILENAATLRVNNDVRQTW